MSSTEKSTEQMTRNLKLAEDRFMTVIEFAPFGMILTNRDGSIELVNKLIETYFGYNRNELIGKKIEMLLPEDIRRQHRGHRNDYNANPDARNMGVGRDLFAVRKDGTRFPVEIGLSPVKTNDGFQVLAAVIDITERKSIEEQVMLYAEELEISNRELQDFATVASHDLQEPLRKIVAFGDFLIQGESKNLSETGRDYLKRMQSAAIRMRQLINDLLALSRVTTAAKPFEVIQLKNIIQMVLQDLELKIAEAQAEINVSVEHSIKADTTQITQLMQNILGNALKYKSRQRTPLVHISSELKNNTCEIRITDNGIGFEQEYAEQIFAPFNRLHDRSEYEGTGIGLAVCRKIVERHKGTITAESQPDQGATFIISLPQNQVESAK